MRNMALLLICLTINFYGCDDKKTRTANSTEIDREDTTTYYLIRHAEKDRTDSTDQNPHLNEAGKARAERWAEILNEVSFDAVYASDFNRTRETAQPLATKNNQTIQTYDVNNLYDQQFKTNTTGKTVLVVGHSNTTPRFANKILGEERYQDMNDSVNGSLYVVTIKDGKVTGELKEY